MTLDSRDKRIGQSIYDAINRISEQCINNEETITSLSVLIIVACKVIEDLVSREFAIDFIEYIYKGLLDGSNTDSNKKTH